MYNVGNYSIGLYILYTFF